MRLVLTGAESLPYTRAKMRGVRVFNWNDLRHFLAVAREGSTGAAAKALGVNQSTVQRRLLALEKGLGCVLVERHATGYRLTEHGKILLASVINVEDAVDAVQRRVASFDDKDVGPVRVPRHRGAAYRQVRPARRVPRASSRHDRRAVDG